MTFDTAQYFGHTTHRESRSEVTQQKVFFWATRRRLIHKSVRGGEGEGGGKHIASADIATVIRCGSHTLPERLFPAQF